MPGWSVDSQLCQRESCGPAPIGQYYVSERTDYTTCESRNCTNAPAGLDYIGGGGKQDLCPFNATVTARQGCGNLAGHFFLSAVREELSRLVSVRF